MAVRTEEGADPHGAWTAVLGLIMSAVILVSVVALQSLFYKVERDEIQRKVGDARNDELTRSQAEQLTNLSSYRWVDEAAGQAAIPIEQAMELVVRDQRTIGNQ